MPDSALRITLTAIWAALHTTQYGLAITGLNGISEALTCASVPVRDDLVAPFNVGWLKPCVPMSVSRPSRLIAPEY